MARLATAPRPIRKGGVGELTRARCIRVYGIGVGYCLGEVGGFHPRRCATIVFIVALVLSMLGLSFAVKTLPTGTAYAVWVGIGTALTVIYGVITGSEPANLARILLIAGLVGCVVGLKLVSGDAA